MCVSAHARPGTRGRSRKRVQTCQVQCQDKYGLMALSQTRATVVKIMQEGVKPGVKNGAALITMEREQQTTRAALAVEAQK